MSAKETGELSATPDGDRLYQRRALQALPLLVRQAEGGRPIEYSDLADELGMPNPRNLNYVLGFIGNKLRDVSERWGSEVPPLQCIVISKKDGLPGEGVGWFLNFPENFRDMSRARKREVIAGKLQDIFAYPRWREVLADLDVPYAPPNFAEENTSAALFDRTGGGGESDEHRLLKEFVARTPSLLGIRWMATGTMELPLPSGDVLDVSFRKDDLWVAAEVKSARSPVQDVVRGIYQCVKYTAVLHAVQTAENIERSARVVLVLGGALPESLVALKNRLGVEVIEQVMPIEA